MKTVSATKVAAAFDAYLKASRQEPVLVTRNGKPVALLLGVQNKAQAEQAAQRGSRPLRSIFEEAHKQLTAGAGIPHEQFWKEVEQSRRGKRTPRSRRRTA